MKTAAHPSMLWFLCTALKENGVAVRHEAWYIYSSVSAPSELNLCCCVIQTENDYDYFVRVILICLHDPNCPKQHQWKEGNLTSFDSKSHHCTRPQPKSNDKNIIYYQSQGLIITSSGVKWTEFSLIIGMGYLVLVLTWSSIPQSVCKPAFSLLTSGCLRRPAWNPGLTNGRQLISFQFAIISLCQSTT